jgi:transposase InsO family protein
MSWKVCSAVSQRREFIELASKPGANIAELCRRFGVSRNNAYKWMERFHTHGPDGLQEQSRRPHQSPAKTHDAIEQQVVALRREHPAWGGRKIAARLKHLGLTPVPAPSTVTGILHRHQLITSQASDAATPWQRFEHEQPNDLWQMDFKGHFATLSGVRCHPLTVLDDHSRYLLTLQACKDERTLTVQQRLEKTFARYGLPRRMLMDNGSPWGGTHSEHCFTPLTVWLIRMGIGIAHGRAFHPQTQGKDERLHRTLNVEVLTGRTFSDVEECQQRFDPWREIYNHQRPHEALAMAVPASRYRASVRSIPATLPPIEYGATDIVRHVAGNGRISLKQHLCAIPKSLEGLPVALRPTTTDGLFEVYFCHQKVCDFNMRGEPDPDAGPHR